MEIANEKKWFVYLGDHHEGPFSLEDIQSKLSQGQVTTQSFVWAEGMTDWKAMTEVSAFSVLMAHGSKEPLMIHVPTAAPPQDEPSVLFSTSEPVLEVTTEMTREGLASGSTNGKAGIPKAAGKSDKAAQKAAAKEAVLAAKAAARAAKAAKKANPSVGAGIIKRLMRLFLFAIFVAGTAVAYMRGYLDHALSTPAVRATIQTASDLSRPYLITLSAKVPLLGQLISSLPALDDVDPKDYEDLRTAAGASIKELGPKVELAVSKTDLLTPTFYVATNLPDGAQFDIVIEGIGDTLLNQLGFSAKVPVTIERSLGKSAAVRFPDGKPLPRGQYKVFAVDSPVQPPQVKTLLASASAIKPPSPLPADSKVFTTHVYFLGGTKDRVYDDRLKEFHDRLQAKAAKELQELGVFAATFESQLNSTTTSFSKLTRGKLGKLQQRQWSDFHGKWGAFQNQMNQSAKTWEENIAKNEIFYSALYLQAQLAEKAVYQVHELENQYFTVSKVDVAALGKQIQENLAQAQSALGTLKSKIAQAQKLPLTSQGMPQREGL